jgi:hypothetical protein
MTPSTDTNSMTMTRPIFASSAVFLVNEREAVEGTAVDDAAAASPRPATSESVEFVEKEHSRTCTNRRA